MSVASEIVRLQNDSAAIASAIEAKGVTVPSDSGYDDYATLIASIPSGGGGSEFDDWKKDGETHLWINIVNNDQLTQYIRIRMIGSIDWGDGSAETSANVTTYTNFSHTYSETGRYVITLKATSGTFYLGGASSNYNVMAGRTNYYRTGVCYQIEIGTKRITTLSNYAFYYLYGLRRIYIPKNITTIGSAVFYMTYSLQEAIFEDSSKITSTSAANIFYYCYNLQSCNFIPPSATSMSATFRNCYALNEITIPSTVTDIAANTFANCTGLKRLNVKPASPPTVADANAFTGLPSGCVIEVPNGKLSNYQSANIWSSYATQMVEAPANS